MTPRTTLNDPRYAWVSNGRKRHASHGWSHVETSCCIGIVQS